MTIDFNEIKTLLSDLQSVCCCVHINEKCIYCRSSEMIKNLSDYDKLLKEEMKKYKLPEEKRAYGIHCIDCGQPVMWERQGNRCGICWKTM